MKRISIIIAIIAFVAFSVVCFSAEPKYKYVASAQSNKYHYSKCKWGAKISSKNLVTFKSAKEALDAGYVPCKVCKPSAKD